MNKPFLVSLLSLLCTTVGLAQNRALNPVSNATPHQTKLEDLLDRVASLAPEVDVRILEPGQETTL